MSPEEVLAYEAEFGFSSIIRIAVSDYKAAASATVQAISEAMGPGETTVAKMIAGSCSDGDLVLTEAATKQIVEQSVAYIIQDHLRQGDQRSPANTLKSVLKTLLAAFNRIHITMERLEAKARALYTVIVNNIRGPQKRFYDQLLPYLERASQNAVLRASIAKAAARSVEAKLRLATTTRQRKQHHDEYKRLKTRLREGSYVGLSAYMKDLIKEACLGDWMDQKTELAKRARFLITSFAQEHTRKIGNVEVRKPGQLFAIKTLLS
jgi:hypothetical protein